MPEPVVVAYGRSPIGRACKGSRIEMRPDDLGADMLRGSRLLYVTGITAMISESCRRSVVRLLELARECEVTVGFDPNIRTKLGGAEQWRDLVGPLLARAGLVFAGEDELAALTGRPAADAAAALLAAGVETVVVWSSDKVATAHTRSGTATREPVPVSAVDPVGAGDAFAAGYLSAWLRGLPVSRALTEAAAVAALVVQSPTDTDGLPDRVGRDRAVAAFTSSVETVHR